MCEPLSPALNAPGMVRPTLLLPPPLPTPSCVATPSPPAAAAAATICPPLMLAPPPPALVAAVTTPSIPVNSVTCVRSAATCASNAAVCCEARRLPLAAAAASTSRRCVRISAEARAANSRADACTSATA